MTLLHQGGQWDMPGFRDANGVVWKWDPTSGTMVPATDHDQRPDIGHASGGDNDLFDPFTHTEQPGTPELEGYMAANTTSEWAKPGEVKCPNCENTTDQHVCPYCGKDLTPEWNQDQNNEFFGVHPPFDPRNEFISDPQRVPKRNPLKTDDTYPSMNLSHYAPLSSVKPYRFSSYAEELAWREANDKNLEDCPECGDVMHDQDGEMVCHGCGHKQKILHTAGAAGALLAPEALGGAAGLLGGEGGGAAAGGIGGLGGMQGLMGANAGLSGIGGLMNHILGVGGNQTNPDAVAQSAPGAMPGMISNVRVASLLGDIVEGIFKAFKNVPDYARQGLQQLPEALSDPRNPLSYADDVAGVFMPQQNQQAFASTDDDEVGNATKNDGTNSDPEEASNSGTEGKKEHGDGPEQLKDVDGIGGPTSPDEAGQLGLEGGADLLDPALQEKALKAFHMNMPLIIELADAGPGSGTDNPIVLALDGLLEQAFPGYRGGTGDGTSEHPQEGNNEKSDDDSDSDSGDSDKDDAESKKEASLWAKQGLWVIADGSKGTWGEDDDDDDKELEHEVEEEEHEAEEEAEHEKKEGQVKTAGMMGGQPNQWGSNAYPGDEFAPGAPGVAAAPQPCAQCGQNHAPGAPCPVDAQQFTPQPMANGAPTVGVPTNTVTTKWQLVASYENIDGFQKEAIPGRPGMDEMYPGLTDAQLQEAYMQGHDRRLEQLPLEPGLVDRRQQPCRNCGTPLDVSGLCPNCPLPDPLGQGNVYGHVSVDDEFGFYGQVTAADHVQHTHNDGEWTDAEGAPLQAGHDYDMVAADYSIPDHITVNAVYPDKISYTMHPASTDPSSLPYHAELSKKEFQTMSYQFIPSEATGNQSDLPAVEAPVRPGQDPTPQVDDLSTPQTVVSKSADPNAWDPNTPLFNGDAPTDRSWILQGNKTNEVLVDPALMAKLAGKDFSGQEQRAFIDEAGVARNLDQLDLSGTHYLDNGVPEEELALW